ncbi:hypothetical protein B0F90DRAFT_1640494 [Multifurca ochricompacta]|uniref:F-box domain-containing protein n=1 Tax=Multifurca ochricompacta TaxID=376703 RepID=A0AAD4QHF6_9AGAM|nr:hypothetical protein B0F90DRAFT_1640494 [Multifurca ochricompacta]
MSLPVEIIDGIVEEVLLSQSRAFSSIAALSVVSRQLRYISLRAYFSRLTVSKLTRAGRILDIPNCCSWIRHLSTTMQIIEKRSLPVSKMKLWSLELTCESVSVFSLAASILLVFPHLPVTTLVSLKLRSLPRITQLLLKEIARRCANLRELELSVIERLSTDCCWACFEESSSGVKHSPVGVDASSCDTTTARDLATLYGRCLQPLANLKRLSIGVFLSSPVVLKKHIEDHSDALARQQQGATGLGCRPYTPTKCVQCWETHGLSTREDELLATMRLAQNLKSLEWVRWSSWFSYWNLPLQVTATANEDDKRDKMNEQERVFGLTKDDVDAQWATFEIERREKRIKVWRRTS